TRGHLADTESGLRAFVQLPNLPDDTALPAADAFVILELASNALPEDNAAPWIEDVKFLKALGVAAEDDFYDVAWTADLVRRGLSLLGKYSTLTPEKFTERTLRELEGHRDSLRERTNELSGEVRELQRRRRTKVARKQARRSLPDDNAEAKVLRY